VSWRIVPGTELGDLARLQSVAELAFGKGDRRPQWFTDKLYREHVDAALTQVAMVDGEPVGYVLAGRPPSLAPIARAAGTAVLEQWRGHGIATALLRAATPDTALELWAEPRLESFYASRGFAVHRRVTTLLAFARGTTSDLPAPLEWDTSGTELPSIEIHAWLAEAWTRTPPSRRHTLRMDDLGAVVHVAREGRAFVLHRTTVRDPKHALDVFDRVLERLPNAAPVLAVALDVAHSMMVSSVTASLRRGAWVDAQRISILRRAGHLAPRHG
jgi:GNAT superfamily N-acetyltransferase